MEPKIEEEKAEMYKNYPYTGFQDPNRYHVFRNVIPGNPPKHSVTFLLKDNDLSSDEKKMKEDYHLSSYLKKMKEDIDLDFYDGGCGSEETDYLDSHLITLEVRTLVDEEDGDKDEGQTDSTAESKDESNTRDLECYEEMELEKSTDQQDMEEEEPVVEKLDEEDDGGKFDVHGSDEPFKGDNNDVAVENNEDGETDAGRKRARIVTGSSVGKSEKKARLPIEAQEAKENRK